jgi:hypothetical protein
LLVGALALSACHATTAATPDPSDPPSSIAATNTSAAPPAPPCPPVHELSYFVGERLLATSARSRVRAGNVHQLCTYAPPHAATAGGPTEHRAAAALVMFRIPAVRGTPSVQAARSYFSRLLHPPRPRGRYGHASLAARPSLGPGAFVLRIPQHHAYPGTCEVVEQNGNGQPIGVTVSAAHVGRRSLELLCRQALAAAHMVP